MQKGGKREVAVFVARFVGAVACWFAVGGLTAWAWMGAREFLAVMGCLALSVAGGMASFWVAPPLVPPEARLREDERRRA